MIYFDFIYLKAVLARIFSSFLTLIPLLARLIILSILLILSKKLVPIRAVSSTNTVSAVVNSWFNQNMKTKPFQSHSKPFFSTPIFDSSPKTRIFDKFRQTFLCKTKPFFSKIQIENKGLTAVSQNLVLGFIPHLL